MQVRCLQLQHLMDTLTVDLIRRIDQFFRTAIRSAETLLDQLLTVLVQQIEGSLVRACRDLDQLRETVADLCGRESSQECEIEEGVDRGVIRSEPVLVVAVVDGNFDGDRGVYQSDDCSWDSNEVRVAAISSACESVHRSQYTYFVPRAG